MSNTIFLAGATGAIGRQLVPLLTKADYRVFGTTRVKERASALEAMGVEPLILDVFDMPGVEAAFSRIRPDILVIMLTDLPRDLDPHAMVEARPRNARVWAEGTRNLMVSAKKVGTRRVVAQSLAWLYAPGPQPHQEADALGAGDADLGVVLEGVSALERAVLDTPPVQGVVLRFGLLYGSGTSSEQAQGSCPLHVQAAAHATYLAIENGRPGVYNVADDNAFASTAKARRELDWNPAFRRAG